MQCVALLGWVMSAAPGMACVFGLHDATANEPMPLWLAAVYNAAGRMAWALSVWPGSSWPASLVMGVSPVLFCP